MANSYSDTLFVLIKSLSKSEKRYFKVYTNRHTNDKKNVSNIVFDYMLNMDIYDEEKLLKHFKNEFFINKFSITKHRIYIQILNSLDSFHSKSSVEAELYRTLHHADILYNKGLYIQTEKLLNNAKKKAVKFNFKHLQLTIIDKQKRLFEKNGYANLKSNDIISIFDEEQSLNNSNNNYAALWKVKSLLIKRINELGNIRCEKEIAELRIIISPIYELTLQDHELENNYLYHHILSAFNFAILDLEKTYIHLKDLLELFETNHHFIQESLNNYFSAITNYIYVCIKTDRLDIANNYLNQFIELENEFAENIDMEIKYFSSRYSLELFLMLEKGNYDDSEKVIEQINNGIEKYGDKINLIRQAYLNFQIAVIYLSQDNHEMALKWINKILNDSNLNQKLDIYSFAHLIQLIIHFELKNYRYLPYVISSTKRFLKSKSRLYKFEEVFLKLIQKVKHEYMNKLDLEDVFISVEKEITNLKTDKFEKIVFEYFDFSAWLKSKIESKPYLEIKKAG